MSNVRKEVEEMRALGTLPSEDNDDDDRLKRFDELYRAIARPVTDEEARVLIELFGPDGCYGLAPSMMHLIETAPGWPLGDCLQNLDNEWRNELKNRAVRGGLLPN